MVLGFVASTLVLVTFCIFVLTGDFCFLALHAYGKQYLERFEYSSCN